MPKITQEMLVRDLPYSVIMKLGNTLDPENQVHDDWRGMAMRIPKEPGSENRRYSHQNIILVGSKCGKQGSSCTIEILSDWGTTNASVKDLVKIFSDMEHYQAISILLGLEFASDEQRREQQRQSFPSGKDEGGYPSSGGETASTIPIKDPLPFDNNSLPIFIPNEVKEFPKMELEIMTNNFQDIKVESGGRLIGQGGFGKVYLGFFRSNIKCAVKVLNREGVAKEAKIEKQFQMEFETLSNLKHKNLLVLLGFCFENLSLVFEYMPNGTLTERLLCKDTETMDPLSWDQRVVIMIGAAEGINFLHNNDYVHRDIKSPNILLDKDLTAKISDFGLVRLIDSDKFSSMTSVVIGTPVYLAPENLNCVFSPQSDVYSFGIVLLEVITGLPVIDEKRESLDIVSYIEDNITKDEEILEIVDKTSAPDNDDDVVAMYQLYTKCTNRKPHNRLEMQEVLKSLKELKRT